MKIQMDEEEAYAKKVRLREKSARLSKQGRRRNARRREHANNPRTK